MDADGLRKWFEKSSTYWDSQWNVGDIDGACALFTPDVVLRSRRNLGGADGVGRAHMLEASWSVHEFFPVCEQQIMRVRIPDCGQVRYEMSDGSGNFISYVGVVRVRAGFISEVTSFDDDEAGIEAAAAEIERMATTG